MARLDALPAALSDLRLSIPDEWMLWGAPSVVLLLALLLLVRQVRFRRPCNLPSLLRKARFDQVESPDEHTRARAWSVLGPWRSLPGGSNTITLLAYGTLALRKVQALVHTPTVRGGTKMIVLSSPIRVQCGAIRLSPREYSPLTGKPVASRVSESPADAFGKRWRIDSGAAPGVSSIFSPGVQALLLAGPRNVLVAIENDVASLACDASATDRDVQAMLRMLPALCDLLESAQEAADQKAKLSAAMAQVEPAPMRWAA